MTTKHTPGPWWAVGNGIDALVRGSDATIVAVRHRLPAKTHEANARLIAAAPELLAVLAALVDSGAHTDACAGSHRAFCDCPIKDARAVIAKATGATP